MVPRSRFSLAGLRLGSAPPQMVERSEIVQAFDEKASCWRQRFNRRNNETWERTILQPPRIALPMVPPASWLRPSMPRMPPPPPPPLAPQPTTQLEKIQLPRKVVDLNIQQILHPQNPAEQDVGKSSRRCTSSVSGHTGASSQENQTAAVGGESDSESDSERGIRTLA